MSLLKRICLCFLLLCTIVCPTWQNTEPRSSDVVLTTLRGSQRSDNVTVCPRKAGKEIDFTYIGSKTMNCFRTEKICGEDGELNGYTCTCKVNNPTYVVSERQCVNNVWLRQGCKFRFGSWRYSSGWTWNELDDPLPYLHLDDGYGITAGFNVSNTEFESCTLENVTVLTEAGVWGKMEFDSNDVKFFVYKRRYHISWNTENLDTESRENMRGRILRFLVKCQPTAPRFQNDIARDPTESCLTFKVTGNFTGSQHKKESNTDKSKGDNTVAIALGVTFSILLVASGVVVGVIFYRRRRYETNIKPTFRTDFTAKNT